MAKLGWAYGNAHVYRHVYTHAYADSTFTLSVTPSASSAAFMLLWISRPAWHTADENDPGAENVPGLVDRWLTGQQVLSWLTRWEAMRCLKDQVQSAPGVKGMAVCGESESCQCVLRVV